MSRRGVSAEDGDFYFCFCCQRTEAKVLLSQDLGPCGRGMHSEWGVHRACLKSPVVALKVSWGRKMDCVTLKSCKIKDAMGLAGRKVLKTVKSGWITAWGWLTVSPTMRLGWDERTTEIWVLFQVPVHTHQWPSPLSHSIISKQIEHSPSSMPLQMQFYYNSVTFCFPCLTEMLNNIPKQRSLADILKDMPDKVAGHREPSTQCLGFKSPNVHAHFKNIWGNHLLSVCFE